MDYELIVRSLRVVTPQGEVAASVAVNSGKIVLVTDFNAQLDGKSDITIEGVLMPGLVDTHVHINEPGRTEWEGFETATKAAAAGGVTNASLSSPSSSSPYALKETKHYDLRSLRMCQEPMHSWRMELQDYYLTTQSGPRNLCYISKLSNDTLRPSRRNLSRFLSL
jgi:hypothetical protein